MEMSTFESLPNEARLWIHGFPRALTQSQIRILRAELDEFVPGWKTHGREVRSGYQIVYDQFLVTAAFRGAGISGCSVDGFFRLLGRLRDEQGIDGLDGSLIYFRGRDGGIQAVNHLDFCDLVESGQVSDDTIVFDTLLDSLGQWREGRFEVSFADSWHVRTFRTTVKAVR